MLSFFIYFLPNRLFFQHIFFVNFAYKSTVDKGSNYCRAKGKWWIIQSVSKWNKQLRYKKTQWSNEHILKNQIWSLKISLCYPLHKCLRWPEFEFIELLTKSCSPKSSITRTILAPIDPPIEQPFRKAARINIGMLVLIVKTTATIKWSRVQKIANVFILKWRERYPKMGRAIALIGFLTCGLQVGAPILEIIKFEAYKISVCRTPRLHQQTHTSTCMHSELMSYHTELLRLLTASLLQGHNIYFRLSTDRQNILTHG